MLLPDPVVPSLQDLAAAARAASLGDLARLGDAVLDATGAEHVNDLILANQVPELHGHVVPGFASEDPGKRLRDPLEANDFGSSPIANPSGAHRELFERLRTVLETRS